ELKSVSFIQKVRQPEKVNPPDRIGHELTEGEGPRLSVRYKFLPRNPSVRFDRVALDVSQLGGRHMRMLFRPPIKHKPTHKPQEPDRHGEHKRPLPSPSYCNKRHKRWRSDNPHIGAGIEQARCQGALLFWEPFGDRLDRRGEVSGFSQAQHEPSYAETHHRA